MVPEHSDGQLYETLSAEQFSTKYSEQDVGESYE